jgi:hypothetical protein
MSATAVGELDAATYLALQHCQLMPERGILGFKSTLRRSLKIVYELGSKGG